jgi:hypothetical protein
LWTLKIKLRISASAARIAHASGCWALCPGAIGAMTGARARIDAIPEREKTGAK